MPTIIFEEKPYKINDWTILRLPKDTSAQLPSRGIAMVKGTMNGSSFQTALEPDGMGSHWFKVDDKMLGSTIKLAIEPTKEWPEPEVSADITKGISADKKAHDTWTKITPMARWEWIRWIRATSKDETRKKRIGVASSKLGSGMRRPCCFNSNMCTEPSVSRGGVLLEPENASTAI